MAAASVATTTPDVSESGAASATTAAGQACGRSASSSGSPTGQTPAFTRRDSGAISFIAPRRRPSSRSAGRDLSRQIAICLTEIGGR